jgi:hypothetical protein
MLSRDRWANVDRVIDECRKTNGVIDWPGTSYYMQGYGVSDLQTYEFEREICFGIWDELYIEDGEVMDTLGYYPRWDMLELPGPEVEELLQDAWDEVVLKVFNDEVLPTYQTLRTTDYCIEMTNFNSYYEPSAYFRTARALYEQPNWLTSIGWMHHMFKDQYKPEAYMALAAFRDISPTRCRQMLYGPQDSWCVESFTKVLNMARWFRDVRETGGVVVNTDLTYQWQVDGLYRWCFGEDNPRINHVQLRQPSFRQPFYSLTTKLGLNRFGHEQGVKRLLNMVKSSLRRTTTEQWAKDLDPWGWYDYCQKHPVIRQHVGGGVYVDYQLY